MKRKTLIIAFLIQALFPFLVKAQSYTLIPDSVFEQVLIDLKIDNDGLNGRVLTSRIENLTSLYINNKAIRSIEGIEGFSKLTDLNCSFNQLTDVDLSSNTALENLNISSNQLTSIDLTFNTALKQFSCSANQLVSLDLSHNTAMVQLNCASNRLVSLDLDNNTALVQLTCSSNQINSLDVGHNTLLAQLMCSSNQIGTLDLSSNDYIATVFCSSNRLTSLNLSAKDSLTFVDCSGNQLTSLNIANDSILRYLMCSRNLLTSLDLHYSDSLRLLYCDNNQLQSLNITRNIFLGNLNASYNKLSVFTTTADNTLTSLDLSNNLITDLSITNFDTLSSLNCSNNRLVSLDLRNGMNNILATLNATGNAGLRCILVDNPAASGTYPGWQKDSFASYNTECHPVTYVPDDNFEAALSEFDDIPGDNYVPTGSIDTITSLDISNLGVSDITGIQDFISLDTLVCSNNSLYNLDVSTLDSLKYLDCSYNYLSSLILKNKPVGILADLDATHNPFLTCIKVDSVEAANNDTTWFKDDTATYHRDCNTGRTYIPDDNFEMALIEMNLDRGSLDNYVVTDSISTVTYLNISDRGIFDLTGIENFTSLDTLDCSSNLLTSLNVRNDTVLKILICYSNYLSSLDVGYNKELHKLSCGNNRITSLDLRQNTGLDSLICDANLLTTIDLSHNLNLVGLNCNSNRLSGLDITDNVGLKQLFCSGNNLTSLDLTNNTELLELVCSDNLLASLDVSRNDTLKRLDCSVNYITALNFSNNHVLEKVNCNSNYLSSLDFTTDSLLRELNCDYNQITDLDISRNDSLRIITASGNKLKELALENNRRLVSLSCNDNYLNTLDISRNDSLKILNCSKNQLSVLDISKNLLLEEFDCSNNKITGIVGLNLCNQLRKISCANNLLSTFNVSSKTLLRILEVNSNQLTELNLDNNSALTRLSCSDNRLTYLDLSNNQNLTSLLCSANNLTGLNLKNAHNGILSSMIATGNSYLTCIEVDDPGVASLNSNWQIDTIAAYSTNCHYAETFVPDDSFEQALVTKGYDSGPLDNYVITSAIDTLKVLNVSGRNIADLTGIQGFVSLRSLNISSNHLDSLDIASNVFLTSLNCSGNLLTRLDLSNNSHLDSLDISANQVPELNLDNMLTLRVLDCSSNDLSELVLSENTGLTYIDVSSNHLKELNIKNGHNTGIVLLNASGNTSLTCIEVDDPVYAGVATGWTKDETAAYSLNCHYNQTYVPDDAFEQALINLGLDYPGTTTLDDYVPTPVISVVANLNINNLNISDLTGIKDFTNLRYLDCSENKLSSLDVSGNPLLERVDCSENQLTNLNVTSSTFLRQLFVNDNKLTSLDIHSCVNLEELNCSINHLTELSIAQNAKLKVLHCFANNFYSVDLKNGNEANLITMDIRNNPTLTCIIVENPAVASAHPYWFKDTWSTYRTECNDDDNDGIQDADDQCPFTPFGDMIDLFGCSVYTLPYQNFTVSVTGETCISSNNGKIDITANSIYNYTATLTGESGITSYNFTNSLEIRNLRSGSYKLCIAVDERSGYSYCYDLIITEPEDLTVISDINQTSRTITLKLSGSDSYLVDLNGLEFNTTDSELTLCLEKGANSITVKTDNECQGVYSRLIFVSDEAMVYPNPASDHLNIFLGNYGQGKVSIKVISLSGNIALSKVYTTQDGYISLDISALAPGPYILVTGSGEMKSTFNIVKE